MSDVANEMFRDNADIEEIETFINQDLNKNKKIKKSPVPSIDLGHVTKYQEEYQIGTMKTVAAESELPI